MARYAIGDIQGCCTELQALLGTIGFDRAKDELWLVGDLVNRGPESLAALRFVRGLGKAAITVLGNHDLHLLTCAEGLATPRADDTLQEVLAAPDRDELLRWLRLQPMLHAQGADVLVHAGLLPQWDVPQARSLAREVEAALRAPGYRDFLARLYGSEPHRWSDSLTGIDRLRVIVNAMTRMRFCTPDGAMDFSSKGEPGKAPPGCQPWFGVPGRASAGHRVIFGHWSALGVHIEPGVAALDSGCVWGGRLTAMRLEDGRLFQVPCRAQPRPGPAR